MTKREKGPAEYRTTGQQLMDFRLANNLSREDLAVFFRVSMSSISRAERRDSLDKPVSVQLQKLLDDIPTGGCDLELVLTIAVEPKRSKVDRRRT